MPPKKRRRKNQANGEGRPWQRKSDGRWMARVWPPEGSIETKPVYVYGATADECARRRDEKRAELAAGVTVRSDPDITVSAYFATWLTTTLNEYVLSGELAASTADSYRDNARLHIVPYLGHIRMRELTVPMVRQWLAKLLVKPSARTPAKPKKGAAPKATPTLSHRTAAICRSVLHKAIEDAIRDDVVPDLTNVVAKVEPPKNRDKPEMEPITPDEAAALLAAAAADDWWCYWLVGFTLGYRRNEGLGMRWVDLDRDRRIWYPKYQVQRQRGEPDPVTGRRKGKLILVPLKTTASRKPVKLPRYAVAALDLWEMQQNGIRATAAVWAETGLVFTTGLGTAIEPRNVNRAWDRVCQRAGTRHINLHQLRHACASYLIDAGVDLKTVQLTMRHAHLRTTIEVYAHAIREIPSGGADAMDEIMARLGAPALAPPWSITAAE